MWGQGDVGMGSHLKVRQGEEELGQPGQLEEEDVAGAEDLGGVAGGETYAERGDISVRGHRSGRKSSHGVGVAPGGTTTRDGTWDGHETAPDGMAMRWHLMAMPREMAPNSMTMRWHPMVWP